MTIETAKEKFIDAYCQASGVTWEWLSGPEGMRVVLPCACSDEKCPGWAMVRNDPESIRIDTKLYGPAGDQS